MSYLDSLPFDESPQPTPVQLFELHDFVKLRNREDMVFIKLTCHKDEEGTVYPTVDRKYFSSLSRYIIPFDKGEKVTIPLFRGRTGKWQFAAYGPHPRPSLEGENVPTDSAKTGIRVTLDPDVTPLLRKLSNHQSLTNSKCVNNILRKHFDL
ncbi:MAG: hypothetical protein ACO3GP_08005 [Candidatus Limnocylindrus sp.]